MRVPTRRDREVLAKAAEIVERELCLEAGAIFRRRRTRWEALGRHLLMRLASEEMELGYADIGRILGRHHTTVIHGERRAADVCAGDPQVAELYAHLVRMVRRHQPRRRRHQPRRAATQEGHAA